ncbi:Helix-turn-helix domain protein [compost metagenome]
MATSESVVVHPNGCMDRQNAAKYLGRSSSTLAQWAMKGIGPKFIKRGRIWYRKSDLETWMSEGEVTSTAQGRLISQGD